MEHLLAALHRFFATWRFPVFALAVLLFAPTTMALVLVVPGSPRGLGAFADDFRTWCFGYDATTDTYEWAYFVMFFANPLLLAGMVVGLWWEPLHELRSGGLRRAFPSLASGAALILVGIAGFGIVVAGEEASASPDVFAVESMRTALPAPEIALVDHERVPVALESLRGEVVVITGVYASCGYACPTILGQAKRAIEALDPEQRNDVVVLAVTLDPRHDSPEVLAEMARVQGVEAPRFRLLTGDPRTVERTLDRIGVARRRDPKSGVIDHTNVFLVVDRSGRVAYRFALGAQQERWMSTAIAHLVTEERHSP